MKLKTGAYYDLPANLPVSLIILPNYDLICATFSVFFKYFKDISVSRTSRQKKWLV